MQIKEIISRLESFAPPELASEWDNSGWQVKLEDDSVEKVLLTLSLTPDVVAQAKALGCGLIVSHHPLFFHKVKNITPNILSNKVAIEAIRNNIQIYSAHTNLDKTVGGINDVLAELFGMKDVQTVGEFVRCGKIDAVPLENFAQKVKKSLHCESVNLTNFAGVETVRTVALCSGAGADLVNSVEADIFITGDVKYHAAIEALDKAVLDVGHFHSERIILPVLQKILAGCETFIAEEKTPWTIL